MRLGILGGGRAAWAFGSAWRRVGWSITGVWLRESSVSRVAELLDAPRRGIADLAADCDLLLLAVSDRALDEVLTRIPPVRATLFHASGATAAPPGGFSLHPLLALPPVGAPSDLEGALLVFEGQQRSVAETIAAGVGARFAEIRAEQKPLYHAAAVFGANYVAVMLEIAARLMHDAGVVGARADLAHLAESAVRNWSAHEDALRFTGPAARGDTAVLDRHLAALAEDPEVAAIYRSLAEQIRGALLARPK